MIDLIAEGRHWASAEWEDPSTVASDRPDFPYGFDQALLRAKAVFANYGTETPTSADVELLLLVARLHWTYLVHRALVEELFERRVVLAAKKEPETAAPTTLSAPTTRLAYIVELPRYTLERLAVLVKNEVELLRAHEISEISSPIAEAEQVLIRARVLEPRK